MTQISSAGGYEGCEGKSTWRLLEMKVLSVRNLEGWRAAGAACAWCMGVKVVYVSGSACGAERRLSRVGEISSASDRGKRRRSRVGDMFSASDRA